MATAHTEIEGWNPPSARSIKELLDRTRSIAIVGASANPSRASNFVITYLKGCSSDFDLYPVNPTTDEINGLTCYPSLADLPVVPDIVDVFRAPADCPGVAREAVELGAKALWLQLGSGARRRRRSPSRADSTWSWTSASRSNTPDSTAGSTWPASTPASSPAAAPDPRIPALGELTPLSGINSPKLRWFREGQQGQGPIEPDSRLTVRMRALVRTSFAVIALTFGLGACGDPDVTRDDLVTMLTERGGENPGDITDEQANCVADVIFADGAYSQSQLNEASRNPSEVEGFQDDIDAAIADCGIGGSR
ncbi:MAG: CoA-binding protein [Acidimicrobiales bacterium]